MVAMPSRCDPQRAYQTRRMAGVRTAHLLFSEASPGSNAERAGELMPFRTRGLSAKYWIAIINRDQIKGVF
jgi:hypothetical protein